MSQIIDEKTRDSMFSSLTELGLSPKESNVYISLLSLGESGTTAISKETNLHRQFVYDTLASLESKGLVSHTIVKGRKKFYSHSPSKLKTYFEHKRRIADEVVKKLETSFLSSDIQELESYSGQEAFVANEFEILKAQPDGARILVFGGSGDEYRESLGVHFQEYEFQRNKKCVEVLYIGSHAQKAFLPKHSHDRNLFKWRLLPEGMSGNLNVSIYSDRINFYMWGNPTAAFSIKSKRIAQSYTDFFMGLWNISK